MTLRQSTDSAVAESVRTGKTVPRRGLAALTAAAAVAAALTGCGTTQEAPPRPSADAIDSRPLTDAEQLRISDAQQRIIRLCMEGKGFTYREAERLSLEESVTHGYVSDDVAWAGKHGYGSRIQAKEDHARTANPNIAYRAGLPEARRKAFDQALDAGVDAPELSVELPTGGTVRKRLGGCVAESEKQLYGDPATWFRAEKTAGSLQALYVPKILDDDQFTQALTAWAQCMRTAGHPYKDPGAAQAAGLRESLRRATAEAFATEREIAVAAAQCARTSSLRTIGNERETHYVNALRGPYGEALDTYARLQHEALARAVKIVPPRT